MMGVLSCSLGSVLSLVDGRVMSINDGCPFLCVNDGCPFLCGNAKLNLPVYLDEEVQSYLQERARSKGVEVAQLVNEMLRQDIKLIEAVK